ncbi:MAG: N-acetylmuramoyl-L-alanine amidase, partial [Ruminiclostridium sp.]|nr:N-acetylmuramoyl-L-alanine amidase [Ruminiclostridium sp.]
PTPTPTPTPTPVPVNPLTVVVDPGHGGYDPGTVSPYEEGFYEKDFNLDVALRLKERLEQQGFKVVMTRETDTALNDYWKADVWARPRIANEVGATFFVSIHVNGFDGKNASVYNGTEIYHQGKNHGEFTSKEIATIMGEEVDAATDTKYNGVIKSNLGVTRLSQMPAVVVETAYIGNLEDHARLKSDQFREDMADGILNGTLRILEKLGAQKEHGVYTIEDEQRESFLVPTPPITDK